MKEHFYTKMQGYIGFGIRHIKWFPGFWWWYKNHLDFYFSMEEPIALLSKFNRYLRDWHFKHYKFHKD
jgi:hypothetical protein